MVTTLLLLRLLLSRFCLSEPYSSLHILGSWPRPPRAWEFLRRRGPFKRQAPGAVAARIGGARSHVAVLAARAVARLWWRQWGFWGVPGKGRKLADVPEEVSGRPHVLYLLPGFSPHEQGEEGRVRGGDHCPWGI